MKTKSPLRAFIRRPLLACTVFFGVLAGICGIGIAFWISKSLDGIFLRNWPISQLVSSLILIGSLGLIRALAAAAQAWFAQKVAQNAKSLIREHLWASHNLESTPWMRGVESLDAWYSQYLPQIFLAALIPLLILGITFVIDPLSSLVFLITAPLLPLFLALIGMTAKKLQAAQWKQLARQGNFYRETLLGLKTLRLFGQSKQWGLRLQESAKILRDATLSILRLAFLSAFVLELVGTVGTAILAVEIGLRLLHGSMEYQAALFILLLAPEFYLPLRMLGLRTHAAMEGQAASESLFPHSIDNPNPISSNSPIVQDIKELKHTNAPSIASKRHLSTIVIHNLTARWPKQQHAVLREFSAQIPAQKLTVIAGPSGCGKSTLLACILDMIPIEEGSIQFAGHSRILWIPQQPQMFHRSIRDNILQIPNAPQQRDSELFVALEQVGLGNFVRNLPQGLNTRIGEGASRLSGGQARRLALARAFLDPMDLILLDEPEAHLDHESIHALELALQNIPDTTRIVVSHRPETIKHADHVIWMETLSEAQRC